MFDSCTDETTGLLMSGGLDSAILLGHLCNEGHRVQPIYVHCGFGWEQVERQAVSQFLAALHDRAIASVVDLQMPVADLYGDHWSMTGRNVPNETTPDEAVFLWGRNPLLLLKAMLWCQLNHVQRLALATLASNPFDDASPQFFRQFTDSLATATGRAVQVLRPFENMSKQEVLTLATGLPLDLTFSCLAPVDGRHCGACNKCRERAAALQSLPGGDATQYNSPLAAAAV
jgi:7-cyano-7-deazaguanine synthase